MASVRGFAIAGGRSIAVVIAGGVAALAVAGASLIPWPSYSVAVPKLAVQPSESRQLRVCPGPFLEVGAAGGPANQVTTIGRAKLTSGTGDGGAATIGSLSSPDVSAVPGGSGGTGSVPAKLEVQPGSVEPGMMAGAQSQQVASESYSGLASTNCAEAFADSWLVGGSAALGRTTMIVLSNPSDAPATVDLSVFGEAGSITSTLGKRVNVPPKTQRVLSLASIAPDNASPVVHVESRGAKVAAALMQSAINGLVPAGIDLVPAVALPLVNTTIAGFVVPQALTASGVEEDDSDAAATLRAYAPGGVDANGTIRLVPEGGGASIELTFSLLANHVADVPLGSVPAGTYTVEVAANVPVVAAARTVLLADDAMTDFAWAVPTPAVHGSLAIAIPDAPGSVLHAANPGDTAINVTLQIRGVPTSLAVPAKGAAQLPVPPNTVIEIQDGAGAHMSVSLSSASGLAVIPAVPPGPAEAGVTVYPR